MHSLGIRDGSVIGIHDDEFIPVDSKAAFEAAVAEKVRVAVVVRRLVESLENGPAEASEMPRDEAALMAKLRAQNAKDEELLLAKLRAECADSRKKKKKEDEEIHKRLLAVWSKKCNNEDDIDNRLFALRLKKLQENEKTENRMLDLWFKEREAARKVEATKKRSAQQTIGRVVSPPCRVRLNGLPGVLKKYNNCACVAERFEEDRTMVVACVSGQIVKVRPECCTLLPWFDIKWEAFTAKALGPLFFVPDEFAIWRGARRRALDRVWFELKSEGIAAALKMWKEAMVESKKAIVAARVELEEARDEALKEVSNAQDSVKVELEQARVEALREIQVAHEDLKIEAQAAIGETSGALKDEIQNQVTATLSGAILPQSMYASTISPERTGLDRSIDSNSMRNSEGLDHIDAEGNKLVVLTEAKEAARDAKDFAKAAAIKREIAELEKMLKVSNGDEMTTTRAATAGATATVEHDALSTEQQISEKRAELVAKKKSATDGHDFKRAAAIKREIDALESKAAARDENGMSRSSDSLETSSRAAAAGATATVEHDAMTELQISEKRAELVAKKKSATDSHDFKRAAAIKREIDALDSKAAARDVDGMPRSSDSLETSSRAAAAGTTTASEFEELTVDNTAQEIAELESQKQAALGNKDFKLAAAIKGELKVLEIKQQRQAVGASAGGTTSPLFDF